MAEETATEAPIESPPAAPVPAKEPDELPRKKLDQLAGELRHSRSRRSLIEYLRLRRSLRI